MLKNTLAVVGLVSLVVLSTSAMLRQVPATPAQTTASTSTCVSPSQLVSFHEDFPVSTTPITRQQLASVPDHGLVVTSVTTSYVMGNGGPWTCDVLENSTIKAGLAGLAGSGTIKPEVAAFAHGLPIAPRASLSLRVLASASPLRVTVTGYVW